MPFKGIKTFRKKVENNLYYEMCNCCFCLCYSPLMIITQKITTLACQLHDGKERNFFTYPEDSIFIPDKILFQIVVDLQRE